MQRAGDASFAAQASQPAVSRITNPLVVEGCRSRRLSKVCRMEFSENADRSVAPRGAEVWASTQPFRLRTSSRARLLHHGAVSIVIRPFLNGPSTTPPPALYPWSTAPLMGVVLLAPGISTVPEKSPLAG